MANNKDTSVEKVKLSCISKGSIAKASSTWKHDTRKFGPQNALDTSSDAAWKSAPSSSESSSSSDDSLAYYEIYFNRPVIVHEMRIQFQGGFVGMDCIVYRKKKKQTKAESSSQQNWDEFEEMYIDPIDTTDVQTFPVDNIIMESDDDDDDDCCSALRIEFGRSTDFYGRIVIYSLEVWGLEMEMETKKEEVLLDAATTSSLSMSCAADSPSNKLVDARQELCNHLSIISDQLKVSNEDKTSFAIPKIEILHAAPRSHIMMCESSSRSSDEYQEGEAYRCKCTFQLEPWSSINEDERNDDSSSASNGTANTDDLIYVLREKGELLALQNNTFPPANIRIRHAMSNFLTHINKRKSTTSADNNCHYEYERLRNNLTSITFVTSWKDGRLDDQAGDCLVTLHYGPPGLLQSTSDQWRDEVKILCKQCQFTLVSGRSKGVVLSVDGSESSSAGTDDNQCNSKSADDIIHDELWLTIHEHTNNEDGVKSIEVEQVSLLPPDTNHHEQHVCIQYEKPSTAFQHPNAGVMLTSLHWILNTLSSISKQHTTSTTRAKPRLLEMYCGCGAHTLPLAKSGLLTEIVAVELDERLVNACRNNCRLNDCLKEDDVHDAEGDDRTLVQVFKGDATEWADKTLRRQNNHQRQQSDDDRYNNFDILLVDPPRDGLSTTVCNMALQGTFSHVIYVSCGRQALLRDLTTLCGKREGDGEGFNVVDLAVIDLFPGTYAVESLVHLKRRPMS